MKELKYRAWDKERQGWKELGVNLTPGGQYYADDGINQTCHYDFMQYIGLRDAHGKEIYEGDIVRALSEDNLYRTGIIEFDEAGASFVLRNEHGRWQRFGVTVFNYDMEIIGNIHENPDLIPAADHQVSS